MSVKANSKSQRYGLKSLLAVLMLASLAACSTPETEVEIEQSGEDTTTQAEDTMPTSPESIDVAASDDSPGRFRDDQLQEYVRTQMLAAPQVDLSQVSADVSNGTVILSGSVDSLAGKLEAEEIAQQTEGITAVTNNVEVVTENLADGEVTASILAALKTEPLLERYEIVVETTNGNVELFGLVDSYLEKQQASKIASRVTGVKTLENDILISSSNSQSDAELEEQVEALLQNIDRNSDAVDLSQVDVAVENRVVTLVGSVPTLYAQRTAIGSALVEGIESVSAEELTVEPTDN